MNYNLSYKEILKNLYFWEIDFIE